METPQDSGLTMVEASRRVAERLLVILENRCHLLMVELQQERERVLGALLMAFIAMVFGMLALGTLTALIVIAFWNTAPIVALAVMTAGYGGVTGFLCWRLARWRRDWLFLAGTLDQLKKDRECFVKNLE